jgi:hypothetical protein
MKAVHGAQSEKPFFLGIALILAFTSSSTAFQVAGTVQKVDSIIQSGDMIGVSGAEVVFTNERNPEESFATTTDTYGNFELDLDANTSVESQGSSKPTIFKLNQNFPNPFNPGTVISYELPSESPVQLEIYNSLGQRVRTIVDAWQEAGFHGMIWDGTDNTGRGLASGVYFYRLHAGSFTESRKMVLVDGAAGRAPSSAVANLGLGAPAKGARGASMPGVHDLEESFDLSVGPAAKMLEERSYSVTIDGFKLVPFLQNEVVVNADTALVFTVDEDQREGIVFLQEGERQLFIDGYGIQEMRDLQQTMHQPVKKGAVIRPNWPAGETSLQTRSAPFWDPLAGVFKMWLIDKLCRVSTDGLHWTLWEPGTESSGEVIFDPIEPDPARRYKSFNPRNLSYSPDGLNWSRITKTRTVRVNGEDRTITSGVTIQSSDEWNFSLDVDERLYIATVKQGGPYGRSVYLATSRNYEDWSEPELIFHADDLDQELGEQNIEDRFADESILDPPWNDPSVHNVDAYNMGLFRYESVYIGTPALYHAVGSVPNYPNTVGFHLVQLMVSRDLRNWERVGNRKPFIGPSRVGSGAYDLTQLIGPSNALVRGDELWFYYTGIKYRGFNYVGTFPSGQYLPLPGSEKDTGAICLAVLRRDGFVSVDAGDDEGVLLTKPLLWRGSALWINADAADGELLVEVLDEDGDPLDSWSRAIVVPITEDGVRQAVNWNSAGNLENLKGQLVRLRFHLRNAELYAFWSE